VFELVLVLKQRDDNGGKLSKKSLQVTNGWGIKALKELQQSHDDKPIRVILHGGSPANDLEIDNTQVEEKNKKKKAGGLAALFRQAKAEEEDSAYYVEIVMDHIQMGKLKLLDRLRYHYLPPNLVISSSLLHFIFAVQTYVMDHVQKNHHLSSDFLI
jgi:hypothetical protein